MREKIKKQMTEKKEKMKEHIDQHKAWIVRVTDNIAQHKILSFVTLFAILFATVASGYYNRIIFLIFSIILAIYAMVIALAFFRKGLKLLFENQGNIYQLIFGYAMAVIGVIFLFTTIYAGIDELNVGYLTYGVCSDRGITGGFQGDTKSVQSFGGTFYFSAVTFFTIGYGDICPMGWDKGIAIFNGFVGSVLTTIILAIAIAKYIGHNRDNK